MVQFISSTSELSMGAGRMKSREKGGGKNFVINKSLITAKHQKVIVFFFFSKIIKEEKFVTNFEIAFTWPLSLTLAVAHNSTRNTG